MQSRRDCRKDRGRNCHVGANLPGSSRPFCAVYKEGICAGSRDDGAVGRQVRLGQRPSLLHMAGGERAGGGGQGRAASAIWNCEGEGCRRQCVSVLQLCAQVDAPEKTGSLLRMCGQAISEGERTHRVSDAFCSASAEGSLRSDVELWRDSGVLSDALAAELRACRRCCIDDTTSESPHRDVSHQVRRASNSDIPSWQAPPG